MLIHLELMEGTFARSPHMQTEGANGEEADAFRYRSLIQWSLLLALAFWQDDEEEEGGSCGRSAKRARQREQSKRVSESEKAGEG